MQNVLPLMCLQNSRKNNFQNASKSYIKLAQQKDDNLYDTDRKKKRFFI